MVEPRYGTIKKADHKILRRIEKAAPDLLAACEAVLSYGDGCDIWCFNYGEDVPDQCNCGVVLVRKAIEKARVD